MKSLNELNLNEIAKIYKIYCRDEIKRRLLDLGFVDKTKIKTVLISPSEGLKAFEIRGSIIAIRNEDAEKILIF